MPRTMNDPRRSEGGGDDLAAAPAPAPRLNIGPSGGAGNSGETLIKKEAEEEETLGQLRDRLGLGASGSARVMTPGPRAPFVHIKVEDSTSGEDTDGVGAGGDGEEASGGEGDGEEDEAGEEEGQQREQHAQAPGASFGGRMAGGADAMATPRRARPPPGCHAVTAVEQDNNLAKGGSTAVHLQCLSPGARLEPGTTRARLRAPGRVAGNDTSQDNDVQHPEEEACFAHALRQPGESRRVGSSRFKGVSWNNSRNKWQARFQRKRLGLHTTEEAAARAYN